MTRACPPPPSFPHSRAKLGHTLDPTKSTDDGIFWMSFEDFVQNFTDVYVCRLFRTVPEGGKWHKYTARGRWSLRDGTAAGSTNNPGADANPQFYIHPKKRCQVFISLSQAETEPELYPIGMYLLRKKGRRCKCRYSGETVGAAKYTIIREVRWRCGGRRAVGVCAFLLRCVDRCVLGSYAARCCLCNSRLTFLPLLPWPCLAIIR